jgi:Ca2+-binding RTX toxin-like protein
MVQARKQQTRLQVEGLEERMVLTGPGMTFDAATGIIAIQGTTYRDIVSVYDMAGKCQISMVAKTTAGATIFEQKFSVDRAAVKRIDFFGSDGNDDFYDMTSFACRAFGQGGNDYLWGGTQRDYLDGGTGMDRILGNAGNDVILGGDGRDFLYGGDGNDDLYGLGGDDYLYGEAGDDRLWGGAGIDYMYGGTGINQLKQD